MKIPLQEKIAELENRISGLELRMAAADNILRRATGHVTMSTTEFLRERDWEKAREHWHEMWRHFDLAMKSIFR